MANFFKKTVQFLFLLLGFATPISFFTAITKQKSTEKIDYHFEEIRLINDLLTRKEKAKIKKASIDTYGDLTNLNNINVHFNGIDYTFKIEDKKLIIGLTNLKTELKNQGISQAELENLFNILLAENLNLKNQIKNFFILSFGNIKDWKILKDLKKKKEYYLTPFFELIDDNYLSSLNYFDINNLILKKENNQLEKITFEDGNELLTYLSLKNFEIKINYEKPFSLFFPISKKQELITIFGNNLYSQNFIENAEKITLRFQNENEKIIFLFYLTQFWLSETIKKNTLRKNFIHQNWEILKLQNFNFEANDNLEIFKTKLKIIINQAKLDIKKQTEEKILLNIDKQISFIKKPFLNYYVKYNLEHIPNLQTMWVSSNDNGRHYRNWKFTGRERYRTMSYGRRSWNVKELEKSYSPAPKKLAEGVWITYSSYEEALKSPSIFSYAKTCEILNKWNNWGEFSNEKCRVGYSFWPGYYNVKLKLSKIRTMWAPIKYFGTEPFFMFVNNDNSLGRIIKNRGSGNKFFRIFFEFINEIPLEMTPQIMLNETKRNWFFKHVKSYIYETYFINENFGDWENFTNSTKTHFLNDLQNQFSINQLKKLKIATKKLFQKNKSENYFDFIFNFKKQNLNFLKDILTYSKKITEINYHQSENLNVDDVLKIVVGSGAFILDFYLRKLTLKKYLPKSSASSASSSASPSASSFYCIENFKKLSKETIFLKSYLNFELKQKQFFLNFWLKNKEINFETLPINQKNILLKYFDENEKVEKLENFLNENSFKNKFFKKEYDKLFIQFKKVIENNKLKINSLGEEFNKPFISSFRFGEFNVEMKPLIIAGGSLIISILTYLTISAKNIQFLV